MRQAHRFAAPWCHGCSSSTLSVDSKANTHTHTHTHHMLATYTLMHAAWLSIPQTLCLHGAAYYGQHSNSPTLALNQRATVGRCMLACSYGSSVSCRLLCYIHHAQTLQRLTTVRVWLPAVSSCRLMSRQLPPLWRQMPRPPKMLQCQHDCCQ
jgi:hypothetical protein